MAVIAQQPVMVMQTQVAPSNATVIVQQPQTQILQLRERAWSTGICGCCEDVSSCCAVYFCFGCYPCYLSSRMNEGTCMPCCVHYAAPALRLKLRTENRISGSILTDCCANYFCAMCMLCQMKRELDYVERMR